MTSRHRGGNWWRSLPYLDSDHHPRQCNPVYYSTNPLYKGLLLPSLSTMPLITPQCRSLLLLMHINKSEVFQAPPATRRGSRGPLLVRVFEVFLFPRLLIYSISEASPEYCGTCLLRKEAVRPAIPLPIHMHAHHVLRGAFAISLFQLLLDLP